MTAALSQYLPDFDLLNRRPAPVVVEEKNNDAFSRAEVDALCAAARNDGRAEAEDEFRRQLAEHLAAERTHHAAEIMDLRAELSALAVETIPSAIAARATDIAEAMAAEIATVIRPLLDEEIARRMVQSLAGEVGSACSLKGAATIRATGPRNLLDQLSAAFGDDCPEIVLVEDDKIDLVVEIDGTRWSSRLEAWAASLKEAFG